MIGKPGNEASPWLYMYMCVCTSLASMTVPTPTVRADLGTLVTSPPKNLALASMVSTANDLILVRDTREEPGSLNAMCPSGPIPARSIHKTVHHGLPFVIMLICAVSVLKLLHLSSFVLRDLCVYELVLVVCEFLLFM